MTRETGGGIWVYVGGRCSIECTHKEELSNSRGNWISCVVYEQVDERHIPSFRIMHQGKDKVGEGAQEDHHYPFAGKANPKVLVMCYSLLRSSYPRALALQPIQFSEPWILHLVASKVVSTSYTRYLSRRGYQGFAVFHA